MIVFLHGPDTYRSRHKVQEIQAQYEKTHQHRVRSFYFDCARAQLAAIQASLGTISLFERKKLVVLESSFQRADIVAWLQAQKEHLHKSTEHIVVVFEPGEIKQKTQNKLYQWLKKHTKQQEFLLLSPAKLKLWIEKEFEKYGLQIAPRAQELLARSGGSDLWKLSNEVRQIAAFKKSEDARQVKENDVILFVSAGVEADVFATIDAVASKNKKQALQLLYRHLKKGDSPHYVFSMLQYQFRTLLEIKDLMDKNVARGAMATQTKLHPYVVQKGMRVAERFSLFELKKIYQKLFELDWYIKTGKAELEGALDVFLATLENPSVQAS